MFFARIFRRKKKKALSWNERFAVGKGTYGEPKIMHWGESATLRIGAYCSIAANVTIFLGGNHRVDWITTYPFSVFRESAKDITGHPSSNGDVVIENDVWLGANSTILSGVHIGNGAVVGACSVVTKDVPAYAIVAGNPAKLVRYRFPDDEISCLNELAWWNWSDTKIDAGVKYLLDGDIPALSAFSEFYDRVGTVDLK